ncbi:DICT sensory domain-containing protein [Natrialbaceae archaeon GCM10025810]|uniref:DICT sensory domain-containing protein n=1 Tax=Halovalidus salilacus TaxID=3075124 RepID=UPI003611B4A6
MSLRSFIDAAADPDLTIAVLDEDGGGSGPLEGLLADAFEGVPGIDVESAVAADVVAPDGLEIDGETAIAFDDGEPVAATPLFELYDSLLAINSDLFVTGARGLGDVELPDVLAALSETRFALRGYPLAHKEKLLLILVSRCVERVAWEANDGTLRAGFQRLSRIDDEIGTRKAYAKLAETAVDVHLYGADRGASRSEDALEGLDATVHAGSSAEHRDSWFVVYAPEKLPASDGETEPTPAALVALETDPRVWEGFWTTDPERVGAIESHIAETL